MKKRIETALLNTKSIDTVMMELSLFVGTSAVVILLTNQIIPLIVSKLETLSLLPNILLLASIVLSTLMIYLLIKSTRLLNREQQAFYYKSLLIMSMLSIGIVIALLAGYNLAAVLPLLPAIIALSSLTGLFALQKIITRPKPIALKITSPYVHEVSPAPDTSKKRVNIFIIGISILLTMTVLTILHFTNGLPLPILLPILTILCSGAALFLLDFLLEAHEKNQGTTTTPRFLLQRYFLLFIVIATPIALIAMLGSMIAPLSLVSQAPLWSTLGTAIMLILLIELKFKSETNDNDADEVTFITEQPVTLEALVSRIRNKNSLDTAEQLELKQDIIGYFTSLCQNQDSSTNCNTYDQMIEKLCTKQQELFPAKEEKSSISNTF